MKGRVSLAALSAGLLVLSFPGFDIGILAWVALIPLLFAVDGQAPAKAFLISYVSGVLFFLGTICWLVHVTLPGMIAVALYLALYFSLFGLGLSILRPLCSGISGLFLIPALWVALEWLRANVLTGFGWVLLAHSQVSNPAVIQIADMAGAYGVSFLVVLVNTAIFLTLKKTGKEERDVVYLMTAITLVFLATAYGILRLKNVFQGERLTVAVVQGNIPQTKKWDFRFRQDIIDKYDTLTRSAAKKRPDLIVWPETSVPGFVESESDLFERVSGLAKGLDTPILVGSPREDDATAGILYNSAILFGRDGRPSGRYDKNHLVPFGEYVPFKKALSFVERLASSPIGDFSGGEELTVFNFFVERASGAEAVRLKLAKKVRFSVLICFEDIFPELARQCVKNGAGFIVNITNDAWFKDTSAPYQHAACSVFRAVENRVAVVRSANTGFSCFIDQKGEVIGSVARGGRSTFIDGYESCPIVLSRTRSFYTVHGDIFAYVCGVFVTLCLFGVIIKKERRELIS